MRLLFSQCLCIIINKISLNLFIICIGTMINYILYNVLYTRNINIVKDKSIDK